MQADGGACLVQTCCQWGVAYSACCLVLVGRTIGDARVSACCRSGSSVDLRTPFGCGLAQLAPAPGGDKDITRVPTKLKRHEKKNKQLLRCDTHDDTSNTYEQV